MRIIGKEHARNILSLSIAPFMEIVGSNAMLKIMLKNLFQILMERRIKLRM
jgi:hypothetical protein